MAENIGDTIEGAFMISKGAMGHFSISIVKSLLRIVGCGMFLWKGSLNCFAGCFLFAELLGIAEEIFDKR